MARPPGKPKLPRSADQKGARKKDSGPASGFCFVAAPVSSGGNSSSPELWNTVIRRTLCSLRDASGTSQPASNPCNLLYPRVEANRGAASSGQSSNDSVGRCPPQHDGRAIGFDRRGVYNPFQPNRNSHPKWPRNWLVRTGAPARPTPVLSFPSCQDRPSPCALQTRPVAQPGSKSQAGGKKKGGGGACAVP